MSFKSNHGTEKNQKSANHGMVTIEELIENLRKIKKIDLNSNGLKSDWIGEDNIFGQLNSDLTKIRAKTKLELKCPICKDDIGSIPNYYCSSDHGHFICTKCFKKCACLQMEVCGLCNKKIINIREYIEGKLEESTNCVVKHSKSKYYNYEEKTYYSASAAPKKSQERPKSTKEREESDNQTEIEEVEDAGKIKKKIDNLAFKLYQIHLRFYTKRITESKKSGEKDPLPKSITKIKETAEVRMSPISSLPFNANTGGYYYPTNNPNIHAFTFGGYSTYGTSYNHLMNSSPVEYNNYNFSPSPPSTVYYNNGHGQYPYYGGYAYSPPRFY